MTENAPGSVNNESIRSRCVHCDRGIWNHGVEGWLDAFGGTDCKPYKTHTPRPVFDGRPPELVQRNLESLVYCITNEPRLFRWHKGRIEWSPVLRFGKRRWLPVPLHSGEKRGS